MTREFGCGGVMPKQAVGPLFHGDLLVLPCGAGKRFSPFFEDRSLDRRGLHPHGGMKGRSNGGSRIVCSLCAMFKNSLTMQNIQATVASLHNYLLSASSARAGACGRGTSAFEIVTNSAREFPIRQGESATREVSRHAIDFRNHAESSLFFVVVRRVLNVIKNISQRARFRLHGVAGAPPLH